MRPTAISASIFPGGIALFGTYGPQPQAGHERMTIGLPIFRDPRELRLDRLITQPFRDDPSAAAAAPAIESEQAGPR